MPSDQVYPKISRRIILLTLATGTPKTVAMVTIIMRVEMEMMHQMSQVNDYTFVSNSIPAISCLNMISYDAA